MDCLFVLTPKDDAAESIYDCKVFDPEGKFLCEIPLKLMLTSVMTLTEDKLCSDDGATCFQTAV